MLFSTSNSFATENARFTEFARTRHYDNVDWHDLSPAITELGVTARTVLRTRGS